MDEKPDPNGCDLLLTWQGKTLKPANKAVLSHNLGGGDRGALNSPKRREGKYPSTLEIPVQ